VTHGRCGVYLSADGTPAWGPREGRSLFSIFAQRNFDWVDKYVRLETGWCVAGRGGGCLSRPNRRDTATKTGGSPGYGRECLLSLGDLRRAPRFIA